MLKKKQKHKDLAINQFRTTAHKERVMKRNFYEYRNKYLNIEEITKTQSLFENLKTLWKIKFKINTAITIINWPISIPIANSMIEINTFSSELTTPKKVLV